MGAAPHSAGNKECDLKGDNLEKESDQAEAF
jgi:hypothetical protein